MVFKGFTCVSIVVGGGGEVVRLASCIWMYLELASGARYFLNSSEVHARSEQVLAGLF